MTPDTDDVEVDEDAVEAWEYANKGPSLSRGATGRLLERLNRAEMELAAVRAIVDSAVTSCELGEAIAAHFGRPLPDWNTD